jgi:hypothetical protein
MVKLENVKELSHRVVEQHNRKGFALVKLTEDPWPAGHVLVNVTSRPLVVRGEALKAKADLRKWLWDERGSAAVRRKSRTWLWSRVVEGKSLVGFAAAVRRDVADRMVLRNPEYQWIEVAQ